MGAKTSGDRGQTLLEMLVALAIAAMIALLIFPSLENGIGALRFRRAADLLESDLRTAHAAAIRSQAPVVLTLSRDGRFFGRLGAPQRPAPDGIDVASSPASIGFFPDGSSTGGTLSVTQAGRRAVFTVDPVTGGVIAGGR